MTTDEQPDSPAAQIEALKDLVQSPGWALFRDFAKQTWDEEFNRRVMEAIGGKMLSDDQLKLAHGRLQQAAAIKEELKTLFKWPVERLRTLTEQVERKDDITTRVGRRPIGL